MTSAMDDAFGARPDRPSHPDFWRLSSVVLDIDGQLQEATTQTARNAALARIVAQYVDQDSLAYVALQRALRALMSTTATDASDIAKLAAVYLDGFITGCAYQKARESQ